MRFQFDGNQAFQLKAIEAVADLFKGQPRTEIDFGTFKLGDIFSPVANRLDLTDLQLLENLNLVQQRAGLPLDSELQFISELITTSRGDEPVKFPNFSVEMETGTGKTYVYLRTALELHRRFGIRKFIVVVPTVAVREGVLKTLRVTETHLRGLYDNVPYRYTVYESRSIGKVRQFAQSDCVELLVMTIDSFNKDDNVIRQRTDRLQGATPVHLIQATRPVLILDEPQNMESESRIRALAYLRPLAALRYSATHRNPYNLVYRLTPFEAYRERLVKHIEVASVVKEDDFNQVFLRVEEIRAEKKKVQARIALHQRMANGTIKEKAYLFKPGDCLRDKSDRPEYETFIIDEVNVTAQTVRFRNGVEIAQGQAQGSDQAALFREQIRYTIEEHFRKQRRLKSMGVKVLSLFFIDRVDNYTGDAPPGKRGEMDGPYPGMIRRAFDEAFDDLKQKYPEFSEQGAAETRAAYFAEKKRAGGATELVDSTSGQNAEDRAAYNLIMKDKERLLSFKEPVAFIFSHSALREGWDNPNVCQICTLNQTVSEAKKRQEVGRGMRLVVNQSGERVRDERANVLTVVANESYEQFVSILQTEMVDAFGKDGAAPKPTDARKKRLVCRRPLDQLPSEFIELWNRIRERTLYQVNVNSEKLVADVVAVLDRLTIDPPRIVAIKAEVKAADDKDELFAQQMTGLSTLTTLVGRLPTPNLVEMLEDLMRHVVPPIKLTRRTLAAMITQTRNCAAALANPQEFALQASRVIREAAVRQLVDGIQYEKIGAWYEMSEWAEVEETGSEKLVPVSNSVYDHIVVQSETERKFAEKLKNRQDVRFFVKLPSWFKVPTPVGQYNPDWALVMEMRDPFGEAAQGQPLLYLVRETKSTTVAAELRGVENQKTHCGSRHFGEALHVDFRVVTSADELP